MSSVDEFSLFPTERRRYASMNLPLTYMLGWAFITANRGL